MFSPWARRRYGFITLEPANQRRIFFRDSQAVRAVDIGPNGELIRESGLLREPGRGDEVFVEMDAAGQLCCWGFLADLRRVQQLHAAGVLAETVRRSKDAPLALQIIYAAGLANSNLQFRLVRRNFSSPRDLWSIIRPTTRLVGKYASGDQPEAWKALGGTLTLSGDRIVSPKHLVELAVVEPQPSEPLITIFSL